MKTLLILLCAGLLAGCSGLGKSVHLERTAWEGPNGLICEYPAEYSATGPLPWARWCLPPPSYDCLIQIDRDILTELLRIADVTCNRDGLTLMLRDKVRTDAEGVRAVGDAAGKAAGVAAKTAVGVP